MRTQTTRRTIFVLIPLILFFLHLLLYGFYRQQKQNLFYACCLLGFAGITYFSYEQGITTDPAFIVLCARLSNLSAGVAILFGHLTVYATAYVRFPRRWQIFFGLFVLLCILMFSHAPLPLRGVAIYMYFGISMIDGTIASMRSDTQNRGGGLLIAGSLLLNLIIVLQLLIDYAIIPPLFGTEQIYVYGMLSLALSMSVYLAYNFGWINKDLQLQLATVKTLSEKALEQERLATRRELERRTAEMESERKTKELESARELQLSLLPQTVPNVEGLDIACFMKTATEVGGDYYDFFTAGKVITAVLGDATGHGLNAGTMVMTTKGLLNVLSGDSALDATLASANRAIKQMKLRKLTMCLAILRIEGETLSYSSAGMPPLLVYSARTGRCEQFVLKAMPLGAVSEFPYRTVSTTLVQGDVIVMVSDGLTEMFNHHGETYGFENVIASLEQHADLSAKEIVQHLFADGTAWADGAPLKDDVSILVIKVLTK
jgi:serine phosphatase RsbU (regulator of sigma subunit)